MEEQYKHLDKRTKGLIKEAGTYKPSADFLSNVMSAVEVIAKKEAYKPLISKSSWFVIFALLLAWMIVFYVYPSSYSSIFKNVEFTNGLSFDNPFSGYEFSKTLVYGLGFLGLFLVQIPFLKRYMEKSITG